MSPKSSTRACYRCQNSMSICLDPWSKKLNSVLILICLGLPLLGLFLFSRILGNKEVPFIFICALSLFCISVFIACFVLVIEQLLLLCLNQFSHIGFRRVSKNFRTPLDTDHFNDTVYILILFQIACENLDSYLDGILDDEDQKANKQVCVYIAWMLQ